MVHILTGLGRDNFRKVLSSCGTRELLEVVEMAWEELRMRGVKGSLRIEGECYTLELGSPEDLLSERSTLSPGGTDPNH